MPYDTLRERVETRPEADPFRPVKLAMLGAAICSGLASLIIAYIAFTGRG